MKADRFPFYWRKRLSVCRHNLTRRAPAKKLRLRRDGDTLRLECEGDCIHIVAPRRWKLYAQGIAYRLEELARQYGARDLIAGGKGGTVIDVGANIGEFSLYCGRQGCRVIAIEPDPRNLAALEKNLAGADARVLPVALWHEDRELNFYSSVERADSSLIRPRHIDRSFRVRARTLDDVVGDLGIGEIFLLKADTEGAEPELLQGATKALAVTRHVLIDCGPERMGQATVAECRDILSAAGFSTRLASEGRTVLVGSNERLATPAALNGSAP